MIKLRFMIAFLLMSVSVTIWADNEVEIVTYKEMLGLNAQNILQIKKGMTASSVIILMKNYQSEVRDGMLNNPWKIETIGNTEIYHYLTRKHPPFTPILENQATPVIFVDGKVSAVGRQFLRDARDNAITTESAQQTSEETIEERLQKLNDLYEKGLIDEETYESQKQRILDSI